MATDTRPALFTGWGFIPDKVKKAQKKMEAYPFDVDAWGILLREAQNQGVEKARNLYELLVSTFSNSGRYWKIYIEQEMKHKNYERVEKLFQRCLMKILNIDLWKCYLNYVKETKGGLATFREKMAQAYDFALDKMGMDIQSHSIWNDYIQFLKAVEAVGSYAENQRITAVRRVYQRGICNPMTNVEGLWKEYTNYENGINPIIAQKMVDDRGRDYMNARRVAKEYEALTKGLNRSAPSVPPTSTLEELKQVELWKKYIQWEKSNPLRTEDKTLITKRVMFAYEQCLLCLGFHPDIWYEDALFLENSSKEFTEKGDMNNAKVFNDEAASVFERAISGPMKTNMLIYFAYADFEEGRMKFDKVHSIFKRLIGIQENDPTLAYIQYMKFGRRAEGIKEARLIFKKAREDPRSKHQIFVAAALMEYYFSKDAQIAIKIFELGLRKYEGTPEYVLAYIDYLSHLNEDNNTRVLFERVLTSGHLPEDKTGEIWLKFQDFEANCGDLNSIVKVEKRRLATFKDESSHKEAALLVDRHRFLDLYPCTQTELKALGYTDILAKPSVVPVASVNNTEAAVAAEVKAEEEETEKKLADCPRPDLSQMLPFRPRKVARIGSHIVPGGEFPLPPAASHTITLLPPPLSFQGPFVRVDELMRLMAECTIPEPKVEEVPVTNGATEAGDGSQDADTTKRKRAADDSTGKANEDSDEEESSQKAPARDIYRSRQQKRAK